MNYWAIILVCVLIAYVAGRADILRRVWKRVSGRERVKLEFTLEFEKHVGEAEAYPRGYGFAYYDWEMDTKIAYPVPFNVIARGARRVWVWYLEWFVGMRRGHSPLDRMLLQARQSGRHESYKRGKQDGFADGFENGYDKGWQEYRDGVLAQLNIRVADKGEESDFPALEGFETANDDNPPA